MSQAARAAGASITHDTVSQHAFLTHTFSECVENHAGMQTIGTKRTEGFAEEYLVERAADYGRAAVHELGVPSLGTPRANVVVFPGAVQHLLGENLSLIHI